MKLFKRRAKPDSQPEGVKGMDPAEAADSAQTSAGEEGEVTAEGADQGRAGPGGASSTARDFSDALRASAERAQPQPGAVYGGVGQPRLRQKAAGPRVVGGARGAVDHG